VKNVRSGWPFVSFTLDFDEITCINFWCYNEFLTSGQDQYVKGLNNSIVHIQRENALFYLMSNALKLESVHHYEN